MNVPTFSLVYTSVRPNYVPDVVRTWLTRARNPGSDVEFVIATDPGDTATAQAVEAIAAEIKASFGTPVIHVVNHYDRNCVGGWNSAAEKSTGKVLIAVADDFLPPPNWDESLKAVKPGWIETDATVHVEDGYVHDIAVLAILTRVRYERFKYIFYPRYQSMFCDTEFTEVSRREGCTIEAKHLLFEHLHPDCRKRQRDAVDIKHASTERWTTGEMLFKFRKSVGFPLDAGPAAGTASAPSTTQSESQLKFVAYMQVIKDDLCLYEVCARLMEEGCRDFFWAVPDEYWSGELVPDSERQTLDPIAERLRIEGAAVHVKYFRVKSYRVKEDDTRIMVETRLRNASLSWIRSQGHNHILIVDGDELWKPGTLESIKSYVLRGCAAVSAKMIPVMGTPGYPIEGATDTAIVYIGANCHFRACRTPTIHPDQLPQICIIHFTSCRKTMEENVAKHRRSGHYDDPDYAFEDWIKNKLPNARPGMRDAHMYVPASIWKSIRNWRPEELAIIPSTLHRYLGQ